MKKFPFKVEYEDNHLLIVNKQSGILVQGDETGDMPLSELVKMYLKEKYNKPGNIFAGVVHRLDRPVSGLVVIAKTSKALERMNKIFHDREVDKIYWALVENKPPQNEGQLVHWLVKNKDRNITTAHRKEVNGSQRAELSYKLIGQVGRFSLLEVKPVTGRPHQIRVQLASMGCPIRGDLKYGYPAENKDMSICLHARRIKFIHPVKKEPIEVTAGLPDTIYWKEFQSIREEN